MMHACICLLAISSHKAFFCKRGCAPAAAHVGSASECMPLCELTGRAQEKSPLSLLLDCGAARYRGRDCGRGVDVIVAYTCLWLPLSLTAPH
mmetsp:Transcript_19059/g.38854  ORF Transcript_19059/g.38854 Transcript_19059/m.38854 type:complete len:92 (+) Transcript_19059:2204-2479(+)